MDGSAEPCLPDIDELLSSSRDDLIAELVTFIETHLSEEVSDILMQPDDAIHYGLSIPYYICYSACFLIPCQVLGPAGGQCNTRSSVTNASNEITSAVRCSARGIPEGAAQTGRRKRERQKKGVFQGQAILPRANLPSYAKLP